MSNRTNTAIHRIIIVLVAILALIILFTVGLYSYNRPINKSDDTLITVTIPDGSSTSQVANVLYDAGLIKSVKGYEILSKFWKYDDKYIGGTYSLSPSMPSSDMARIIVSGQQDTDALTIPAGYTMYQTIQAIANTGRADYDTLLELVTDANKFSRFDYLSDSISSTNTLEGFLCPGTYIIATDADEEQLITSLLNQSEIIWNKDYEARAKELKLSHYEIITIASIIEAEAPQDDDKAKLSCVIHNRLKDDMNLDIASPLKYDLKKSSELTSAELKTESPFNTYTTPGLPVGPICSPSQASIEAALYPANKKYLYYAASGKGDGSLVFADTLDKSDRISAAYSNITESEKSEE